MPATSCSTDIPRFWPPMGPNRNNRSWKPSSTWWADAGSPSAPNAVRIRARCGAAAIVFPSGEGRETKWHCALVRAMEFLHLAKVCRNRGAGAFACQPRTRPRPIGWIRYQTGANRIVLHIVNDAGQFHFIPHTMVKRFILPESLSRSAQDQVALSCRGAFQPARNYRQLDLGPQQHMHVIRHDHPGSKLVEVSSALAMQQGMGHHICYTRIPQPNRSESSFVGFAV